MIKSKIRVTGFWENSGKDASYVVTVKHDDDTPWIDICDEADEKIPERRGDSFFADFHEEID